MNLYINQYGAYVCCGYLGGVRNGFILTVIGNGMVRIDGLPQNTPFVVNDYFRNLDTAFAEISKYYNTDIEQYSRIENVNSVEKLRAYFE